MTFGYLPAPIFILLFITISISLVFYAFKIRKQEKSLTFWGYFLMGSAGFFEVLDKIVNVYWQNLIDYTTKIRLLVGALLTLGFVLLTIPGWEKTKNDPKKRRVLLICFGIIFISILFFVTIISLGTRFSR